MVAAVSDLSDLLVRANDANPMTTRARAKRIDNRLHYGTIAAYQAGKHPSRPDAATLEFLAEAYDVPLRQVQEAAHVPVGGGSWSPPPEVSQLTRRQQDAISELIRAIASAGVQERKASNEPGLIIGAPTDPDDVLSWSRPDDDEPGHNSSGQ